MLKLSKKGAKILLLLLATLAVLTTNNAAAYPLQDYERTGISRLEGYFHSLRTPSGARNIVPGARLASEEIRLRLLKRSFPLPSYDQEFSAELRKIISPYANAVSLAVVDISDPDNPRYGAHNASQSFMLSSCGKVLIALAILQALADIYPDDIPAREQILRETIIVADEFINTDHHLLPFWHPEQGEIAFRHLEIGDSANLWTHLDWMLSASSSAAASMLMKHVVLMRHFGKNYPPSDEAESAFWARTPEHKLRELVVSGMRRAPLANGLNPEALMQYGFFTRHARSKIGTRGSVATPAELLKLLLLMEQGRLIDPFSSLELKKLMYLTQRRARYSAASVLDNSAAYIKTGSWYRCREERGFSCTKFRGNATNLMNAVALIESPAKDPCLAYMVVLTSNVLRRDSNELHIEIATKLHHFIRSSNAELMSRCTVATPRVIEIQRVRQAH